MIYLFDVRGVVLAILFMSLVCSTTCNEAKKVESSLTKLLSSESKLKPNFLKQRKDSVQSSLSFSKFEKKNTNKEHGKNVDENGRYFVIDTGTTDTYGTIDFLASFGSVAFALVCALAFLGILLAVIDKIQATPSTYPTTYAGYGSHVMDTYSSYKRAFDVATALDRAHNAYDDHGLQHRTSYMG